MLTVGSLFSGIGGLDLGLERAGMTVKWQSEIDPYACRVLKKHWPDVPNLGNIKGINWKEVEKVDVICGGYPCQPFSTAGKRNGEEDPRHLWPWVREAISELRPHYAILENVRGHLSLGGLSVIGELASIGYDAEWRVISAASVGANHKRDRIVIVAYSNCCDSSDGGQCSSVSCQGGSRRDDGSGSGSDSREVSVGGTGETSSDVADTQKQCGNGRRNGDIFGQSATDWIQGTARGKGCHGGFTNWEVEPDVGRVAHGIPSRVDRLRGLGNAVVPQVAEIVGRLIMEAHNEYL
jgi:DNA (cytosine-5)-methyltransferase 1